MKVPFTCLLYQDSCGIIGSKDESVWGREAPLWVNMCACNGRTDSCLSERPKPIYPMRLSLRYPFPYPAPGQFPCRLAHCRRMPFWHLSFPFSSNISQLPIQVLKSICCVFNEDPALSAFASINQNQSQESGGEISFGPGSRANFHRFQ